MSENRRLLLLLLLVSVCSITYWLHVLVFWHPIQKEQLPIQEEQLPIQKELSYNWSESFTVVEESTMMPLAPCPDTSPHLAGPLYEGLELNWNLTLEAVRNEMDPVLRMGGRFAPPDCISLHKVAIIIPFRNRHSHLVHWLHHVHPVLQRQQLDYGVYVINQAGEGTFNRAKLLNVGVAEALKEDNYTCFVFSDVDLIPLDDRNSYGCFSNPRHLAVAMDKFNFMMPYHTFFGGVSSLSKEQYLAINGFSNNYWGWGAEDDDMYNRVVLRKMTVSRPSLAIGRYKMIKHNRDLHNEPGPQNAGMLANTKNTMETDGINSLKYNLLKVEKDKLYTYITVDVGRPE